jgi:2-oxoacid:acceptor oxidoreductase gamma subunit (pyruvate/2-ketoisovalerate family)
MAGELVGCLALVGKYASSIPMFGFERRGTPVEAYIRMDDAPIREKTKIYTPDCVVVMDPTLLAAVDVFAGLRGDGILVMNHKGTPKDLELPLTVKKVGLVDASPIAVSLLGAPITNTCMMGAFAATTGWIDLDSILEGLAADFSGEKLEKNRKAAELGFANCKTFDLARRLA